MDEKVFVNEDETAEGITGLPGRLLHKPHGVIKFPAALDEGNVLSLEKVRCAAKVATIRAAESAGNVRHLCLKWKRINPRRLDGGVGVADRSVSVLSQEPPHITDSLFPTDQITEGTQDIIRKDSSIAPEDNV
jgi:hypothetical protein